MRTTPLIAKAMSGTSIYFRTPLEQVQVATLGAMPLKLVSFETEYKI